MLDPLEGAVLWAAYGLLRLLPIGVASALGGALFRTIGPLLPVTRRADGNIAFALPDLGRAQRRKIVTAMWDNLGRVFAEYPHLRRILADPRRVTVEGEEQLALLADNGQAVIGITAHIGNWEVAARLTSYTDQPVHAIYRAPNNRFADRLLRRIRQDSQGFTLIRKGRQAVPAALRVAKAGGVMAILVDQKLREGLTVPFFGQPAKTTPFAAIVARQRGGVVVPLRVVRRAGATFCLKIEPPLQIPHTADAESDIAAATEQQNAVVERWVREQPGQWLWLHRRWGTLR